MKFPIVLFFIFSPVLLHAQYSYYEQFPEHSPHYSEQLSVENTSKKSLSEKLLNPFRSKPGVALLGSLAIPGFSQATRGKWIRASTYLAIEAITIVSHYYYLTEGRSNNKQYNSFVNTNWSVQKYAEFLVDYHAVNNPNLGVTLDDLVNSGANVTQGQYNYGTGDWDKINLQSLRELENLTLYDFSRNSNAFSHNLPDYGSQQYFELVSKYFQFIGGWRDFTTPAADVDWSLEGASPFFRQGATDAREFNDQLRIASNIFSLIVLNHVISGFDAFFTVKLQNYQQAQNKSPMVSGVSVSIPF